MPFTKYLLFSHGPGSRKLSRAQMNLHEVQCHLDSQERRQFFFVKILDHFCYRNFKSSSYLNLYLQLFGFPDPIFQTDISTYR